MKLYFNFFQVSFFFKQSPPEVNDGLLTEIESGIINLDSKLGGVVFKMNESSAPAWVPVLKFDNLNTGYAFEYSRERVNVFFKSNSSNMDIKDNSIKNMEELLHVIDLSKKILDFFVKNNHLIGRLGVAIDLHIDIGEESSRYLSRKYLSESNTFYVNEKLDAVDLTIVEDVENLEEGGLNVSLLKRVASLKKISNKSDNTRVRLLLDVYTPKDKLYDYNIESGAVEDLSKVSLDEMDKLIEHVCQKKSP